MEKRVTILQGRNQMACKLSKYAQYLPALGWRYELQSNGKFTGWNHGQYQSKDRESFGDKDKVWVMTDKLK